MPSARLNDPDQGRDRPNAPANLRPSANLNVDRYDFARQTLADLKATLPSGLVYDIGPGDAGLKPDVETLGMTWRGYDYQAWRLAELWHLDDPCPTDEKCGAALLLDVIEHCTSPGLALRNLSAAMLPGALLVVTVPNPRWSASRLNGLLRGYVSGFAPIDLENNHHVFTPWPHVLQKMLADAGLAVELYVTLDGRTNPFRQRPSALYPLRVAGGFVRMAIEAADPAACGMGYAYLARKL